jgi:hypothetical protein
MQETNELLVTPRLFEQILKSESNLLALQANNIGEALAQFRQLAMRNGQSVYSWDPENGIAALRESELRVPGSKRLGDAFRFILQSVQYAIYLFVDYDEQLKPPNTILLRRFARIRTGNQRKIVFVSNDARLPEEIEALVEPLNSVNEVMVRPRLRDGRWVV